MWIKAFRSFTMTVCQIRKLRQTNLTASSRYIEMKNKIIVIIVFKVVQISLVLDQDAFLRLL